MKSLPECVGTDCFRVGLEMAPVGNSQQDVFWLILVNDSQRRLLGVEILDQEPGFDACRDWLLSVLAEQPELPATLIVNEPNLYAALRFSLRPYKLPVKAESEPQSLLEWVADLRVCR